jgi:alkanesulfonate monooxygenase SsuD/methylene tetrahydromethanopterin reductase-like flavin-dependent oxidoreductase (luciferase family)
MLEGYATLGYLAAATRQVTLGTLVTRERAAPFSTCRTCMS